MHQIFDLESVVIGLLIIVALEAIILWLMYSDFRNKIAEAKINCRGYIDNNIKDVNDRIDNAKRIACEYSDTRIKESEDRITSIKPVAKRKTKINVLD